MRYLLIANETDDAFETRTDPAGSDDYWETWMAFGAALREAGVLLDGAALQPPGTATTLRIRDGAHLVEDGPFAETKEHLGGYFVIEVPGLDEALTWAARCPSAGYGSVEVRPLVPPMG